MSQKVFEYIGITLEVSYAEERELDVRDVFDNGSRLSFEGGKFIIDFVLRVVLEERGARLAYRVLEGKTEVFAVSGSGSRSYRGGTRRGTVLGTVGFGF